MIYLIFSREGYDSIQAALLEQQAALWLNPELLQPEEIAQLTTHGIDVQLLPESVKPGDEKAMLAALDYVEQHGNDPDIMVEYL
ncbi:hypothetical protein MPL1_01293 [Methylophaga lonarensis MPL]|uniref:Uncharacterized protein n=1 Tax=Methylophaga lonarensis MPL TaxID=1286106 RepID=M7P3L5_9GAMM|nr:hypothetical protein [Methylophaga lonarensis]EMR14107.1 hypothetical protein MPL1_01293 [Methylophaga lonarensis MPL]